MINSWDKIQSDFLLLSTKSKQIFVLKSGHYINQEQPKAIENVINDMVNNLTYPRKFYI